MSGIAIKSMVELFFAMLIQRLYMLKIKYCSAQETLLLPSFVFEEWLWEQAAAGAKHYHSDNGVLNAELFKESCRDGGQTQSFSGVGAKHQNA